MTLGSEFEPHNYAPLTCHLDQYPQSSGLYIPYCANPSTKLERGVAELVLRYGSACTSLSWARKFPAVTVISTPARSTYPRRLPLPTWFLHPERLDLGFPSPFNICQISFRSLHASSNRCPHLRRVCIHFNRSNTSNFAQLGHQKRIQEPRSRSKGVVCWVLYVPSSLLLS